VKRILGVSAQAGMASVIPHGGPAIAIFVAGLFVAVVAAIVAMEKQRKPLRWAIIGFVVTLIVVSAAYAVFSS
jgi:hypothetical protein